MLKNQELAKFLEEKSIFYNNPTFIKSDPIQVPHQFNKKEDIEIAAFFTASIAWGQRKTIICNANKLMRWMIRKDNRGVDFGLWDIPSSVLYIPLDVHTGTVARKLNLLKRGINDWKSVEELTNNLKKFDPVDPVKYDFALFGLGAFENF